jgi:ribulose-5-phosphate 4-epimerase/fuculose-1-phosphate aldolase
MDTELDLSDADLEQQEREIRKDLAACYRLVDHFGWTDLIFTHISARVPGPEHHFLINPFGLMFDEITASNLVKIDMDGNPVEPTPYSVNRAGFVIHSAVHMYRPDAKAVLHLHGLDGAAVSASEDGLLPLTQTAMGILGDLAYHDYAITLDESLRRKLADDIGDKNCVILRNHGTLTLGETPAEAFGRAYMLEWACTVQVRAQASARVLRLPDPSIVDEVARIAKPATAPGLNNTLWPALKRLMDRKDPSYRS